MKFFGFGKNKHVHDFDLWFEVSRREIHLYDAGADRYPVNTTLRIVQARLCFDCGFQELHTQEVPV